MEKKYKLSLYWKIRKFFGADVVALQDNDGEVTITVARVNPFGGLSAKRWKYPIAGNVTLNDDGNTEGIDYVKRWKRL